MDLDLLEIHKINSNFKAKEKERGMAVCMDAMGVVLTRLLRKHGSRYLEKPMGNSCFIVHRWQKWSSVQERSMINLITFCDGKQTKQPYTQRYQDRICNRCGQVQERTV